MTGKRKGNQKLFIVIRSIDSKIRLLLIRKAMRVVQTAVYTDNDKSLKSSWQVWTTPTKEVYKIFKEAGRKKVSLFSKE